MLQLTNHLKIKIDTLYSLPSHQFKISAEDTTDPFFVTIPQHAGRAYDEMRRALLSDTKLKLKVGSCYRSPAHQFMILLAELYRHSYDLSAAQKRVDMPYYSEHNDPIQTACDFDIDDDSDPKFKWLTKHAANYGFTLSFPQNNKAGKLFEPWHWRFIE